MPVQIKWVPSQRVGPADDGDTSPGAPWHIAALGIDVLWKRGVEGDGIRVAILDTGIEQVSSAFGAGRVLYFDPDGSPLRSSPGSARDHGTMCASLIGSHHPAAPGVAPKATLLSFRVDGSSGRPTLAKVRAALQEGIRKAAANVVSCSFVLSEVDEEIRDAVRGARAEGVFLVAAAGNDEHVTSGFPELTAEAFCVSAVDSHNNPMRGMRSGHWIDAAAPGDHVKVMTAAGVAATWLGQTSGATALVAGIGALMLSAVDRAVRRDVALALPGLIQATARDVGPPGADPFCGAGLIQPMALYDAVTAVAASLAGSSR